MSNSVSLIFPHQLYQHNPVLISGVKVILIEEALYFQQYNFHKQKLVLHRASMKSYEDLLIKSGKTVNYINHYDEQSNSSLLIKELAADGISNVHIVDVVDNWLMNKLKSACKKWGIHLEIHKCPNFLNTVQELDGFFENRKTYFQTDFYTWQRRQRKILLDQNNKPLGGKWTFDAENRSKFPKNGILPKITYPSADSFVEEAEQYVSKYFPFNYGSVDRQHLFAINHTDANNWLDEFLEKRFEHFGIYEDAIVTTETVLHHSVLSPMLNIGLLHPQQIIEKSLSVGIKNNIPLNSIEGFVRQLMGWREFIRIVYEKEGGKQRTTNYWKFKRKIPPCFWTGTTGIHPIDTTIHKVLKSGYCHHIERLMVLGNFMLLCEFDPNEVYKWFMEMFIDAYDWVMVPNVYGMTQFADGGLMTTKPYISGSNYLMKMSNYEKGPWQEVWDGLFWRFMHEHRSFFMTNPRLGMLVGTFDKMNPEKQATHLKNANNFLDQLDKQNTL